MDLLERLRKVEPDLPGDRTRWYRNPDGHEAADEIERLREALRKIGEGDSCISLMTHPPICKRAYDARAALKEKEDV